MATILMNGNEPVLKFDLESGLFEILNETLLPFTLRGKLRKVPEIVEGASKYELTQSLIAMNKNNQAITSFFASRLLPLTRENAKKIYSLFSFDQAQDDHTRALISILCRSVSLQDNYWVKADTDTIKWQDVNLRHNSLSETVAQVSLHGTSLTLRGEEHTPELNGQGAYAKAWKREPNGLFLYKLGSNGSDIESKIEVTVSKILDKCNIPHVHYYEASSQGRYACKCKCMTTDNLSILSGMDFRAYCSVNGKDSEREILALDKENIYKMWIADYLISNRDRHSMNWGLFYNPNNMELLGCHPLFDHNNAFDQELMKDKNAPYTYDNKMTMREAASFASRNVNVHFFDSVKQEDFLNKEQYESFLDRAADLHIKPVLNLTQIPISLKKEQLKVAEEIKNELRIPHDEGLYIEQDQNNVKEPKPVSHSKTKNINLYHEL